MDKTKEGILEIYEELKSRIANRIMMPDVKINQNQIAKELNVSRTPVEKALYMLKTEGLVDNIPNKGFYVHKSSLQDTVELYEIRQVVEMVAAANIAEYASDENIENLGKVFLPFVGQDHIDLVEYAGADRLFHSRLIELSQNNLLKKVERSIMLLPKVFIFGLLRSPQATLHEHLDIVRAMKLRDAKQAQYLAQNHLMLTLKALKDAADGLKKIGVDPRKISVTDIVLEAQSGSLDVNL